MVLAVWAWPRVAEVRRVTVTDTHVLSVGPVLLFWVDDHVLWDVLCVRPCEPFVIVKVLANIVLGLFQEEQLRVEEPPEGGG